MKAKIKTIKEFTIIQCVFLLTILVITISSYSQNKEDLTLEKKQETPEKKNSSSSNNEKKEIEFKDKWFLDFKVGGNISLLQGIDGTVGTGFLGGLGLQKPLFTDYTSAIFRVYYNQRNYSINNTDDTKSILRTDTISFPLGVKLGFFTGDYYPYLIIAGEGNYIFQSRLDVDDTDAYSFDKYLNKFNYGLMLELGMDYDTALGPLSLGLSFHYSMNDTVKDEIPFDKKTKLHQLHLIVGLMFDITPSPEQPKNLPKPIQKRKLIKTDISEETEIIESDVPRAPKTIPYLQPNWDIITPDGDTDNDSLVIRIKNLDTDVVKESLIVIF